MTHHKEKKEIDKFQREAMNEKGGGVREAIQGSCGDWLWRLYLWVIVSARCLVCWVGDSDEEEEDGLTWGR